MPYRTTGPPMHELGARVLEKKSGNSTFINWRRRKGISTARSQAPDCGIKICIFGRKRAVSSCNIIIADHSTGRQSAAAPQEEQAGFGVENFRFKRYQPNNLHHHIYLKEESKAVRQPQRRLNPHMQEVVRIEVLKLLQAGIIYPISDSTWVSPTQVVPKKSGVTTMQNAKGEEIPTRLTTGWRVCIDYRRLNEVIRKYHFPLPFMDQLLERVSGNPFYCFLDGYSGYFQIEIVADNQEKTTFTCPFGTYAYRRMPFGLCNAPATFQRCMLSIFSDLVEHIMEVYVDDITVYGESFDECLIHLETFLNRCIEKNLVLNWEKCHFMVNQGIVLGHVISEKGIEVDRAKVELISKLPSPTNVKTVRQFLRHAGSTGGSYRTSQKLPSHFISS